MTILDCAVYNRQRIGNPLGASLGYLTPAEFDAPLPQHPYPGAAHVS
jgi:hypothetical protein